MSAVVFEMESLEDLAERTARLLARQEDDREALLEELIEALVRAVPLEEDAGFREASADEFTCSACHLVLSRNRLVDEHEMRCADCVTSRSC